MNNASSSSSFCPNQQRPPPLFKSEKRLFSSWATLRWPSPAGVGSGASRLLFCTPASSTIHHIKLTAVPTQPGLLGRNAGQGGEGHLCFSFVGPVWRDPRHLYPRAIDMLHPSVRRVKIAVPHASQRRRLWPRSACEADSQAPSSRTRVQRSWQKSTIRRDPNRHWFRDPNVGE